MPAPPRAADPAYLGPTPAPRTTVPPTRPAATFDPPARPPRGTKITGSNNIPLGRPKTAGAAQASTFVIPNRGPPETSVSYVSTNPVSAPSAPSRGANAPPGADVPSKQWPPSLKEYVTRVFRAVPKSSRAEVQTALKSIIQGVSARDELWTVDWESAPLGIAEILAGAAPTALDGGVQAFSAGRSTSRSTAAKKRKKGFQKGAGAGSGKPPMLDRLTGGPAWDPVEHSKRARRAGRFGYGNADGAVPKGGGGCGTTDWTSFNSSGVVRGRAAALQLALQAEEGDGEVDWDAFAVKGTCQSLEKSYFRLTSAPDPLTVRPQPTLELALQRLQERVESGKKNYFYAQDQLKAIRQDCTVQHVRNAFTVQVYETHGRLALRHGELADYNQCQTQLINLYREGLEGEEGEFLAYRVLYQTFQGAAGGGEMLKTLRRSGAFRSDPRVRHALAVRRAVVSGDYVSFFSLHGSASELIRSLMDVYLEKMRFEGLECICLAYLPSLPLDRAAKALGFGGDLEGCKQWLEAHGAHLGGSPPEFLDTKASRGNLFVPEDDARVAHGDRNLAIDDFLSRTAAE